MQLTSTNRSAPITGVTIVGAGPYGLSIAAHLAPFPFQTRIFGTPMRSWRDHMPPGMKLKSEGFASSLYNPGNTFTLRHFCLENNLPYADTGLPVALEIFTAYGLEFQRRFVPHLEQTGIVSIHRVPAGFALTTASGEQFQTRKLILAVGIEPFPYIPPILAGLPAGHLTHTFDHGDLSAFRDRKVAVIGAGASAVDVAALLHEAGAEVHIVTRSAGIAFHAPPGPRSLLQRLKNPRSGLGLGWKSKLCADLPLLFHALPAKLRLRAVARHLGPAPGWFVRDKVVGLIPMHLNASIAEASLHDGQVHLTLTQPGSKASTLTVDHIIAGTGFRVSISSLPMLDDDLRASLQTLQGAPVLSCNLESSVPGLYFAGLAAANSFGPLLRFACGAEFTAARLARHLKDQPA